MPPLFRAASSAQGPFSILQVKVLPQEKVSCLRSYGVCVKGDRDTGTTPHKRGPRPRPWARATLQPATQVNRHKPRKRHARQRDARDARMNGSGSRKGGIGQVTREKATVTAQMRSEGPVQERSTFRSRKGGGSIEVGLTVMIVVRYQEAGLISPLRRR